MSDLDLDVALRRADEAEDKLNRRWKADRCAIARWEKRTGRSAGTPESLNWPRQEDLIVWLLDERDKEKRKSWWGGAMWAWASVVISTIVISAFI